MRCDAGSDVINTQELTELPARESYVSLSSGVYFAMLQLSDNCRGKDTN